MEIRSRDGNRQGERKAVVCYTKARIALTIKLISAIIITLIKGGTEEDKYG